MKKKGRGLITFTVPSSVTPRHRQEWIELSIRSRPVSMEARRTARRCKLCHQPRQSSGQIKSVSLLDSRNHDGPKEEYVWQYNKSVTTEDEHEKPMENKTTNSQARRIKHTTQRTGTYIALRIDFHLGHGVIELHILLAYGATVLDHLDSFSQSVRLNHPRVQGGFGDKCHAGGGHEGLSNKRDRYCRQHVMGNE